MVPIIDLHCDTVMHIYYDALQKKGADAAHIRSNMLHISLENMKKAGYMGQAFAMFVDKAAYPKYAADPFDYLVAYSECMDREIAANGDLIRYALTGTEMEQNYRAGLLSALKTAEEGLPYHGDVARLQKAYDMGVRMSTLTWNYENELGYPNPDGPKDRYDTENGLKEAGFRLVEAMEELGMIIDISHLNDAGIDDVFRTVKPSTPVIASHSNPRGICRHKRNLSDAMLRQIADHGGVAGLNFCPFFLTEKDWGAACPEDCESRIEDMLRCLDYVRRHGGIDILALGSDFDGIKGKLEMDSCAKMQMLMDAMSRGGFTDDEIEKVMYRNALRVFKEVLG